MQASLHLASLKLVKILCPSSTSLPSAKAKSGGDAIDLISFTRIHSQLDIDDHQGLTFILSFSQPPPQGETCFNVAVTQCATAAQVCFEINYSRFHQRAKSPDKDQNASQANILTGHKV